MATRSADLDSPLHKDSENTTNGKVATRTADPASRNAPESTTKSSAVRQSMERREMVQTDIKGSSEDGNKQDRGDGSVLSGQKEAKDTPERPDGPSRLASLGLLKYANVGSLSEVYRKTGESASPPLGSSVSLGKRVREPIEDGSDEDYQSPDPADPDFNSSTSSPHAGRGSERSSDNHRGHGSGKARRNLQRPKLKGTACTACRKSKLKCDEEQPCAPCQKRKVDCVRDPGIRMYRMLQEHLANTAARTGEPPYGLPPLASSSSAPFFPSQPQPVEDYHQQIASNSAYTYRDAEQSRTARQHVPLASSQHSAQRTSNSPGVSQATRGLVNPYPSPISSTMSLQPAHQVNNDQQLPSVKQEADGIDEETPTSASHQARRSTSSTAEAVPSAVRSEQTSSPRFLNNILNDSSTDFPPYLECWRGVLYEAGIDNMLTFRSEIHMDMVRDYVDFLAEAYPDKITSMTQRFKLKFALEKALKEQEQQ